MERLLRPAIWSHYSKVAEQVVDYTPAVPEAPTLQLVWSKSSELLLCSLSSSVIVSCLLYKEQEGFKYLTF